MNGGRQSNGALRPLLVVWVLHFLGDFFLVPQPQQTRTSLDAPGISFRFFFVESSRTQPELTDRHRKSPLRAHFNTPENRRFARSPPRELWALAAVR